MTQFTITPAKQRQLCSMAQQSHDGCSNEERIAVWRHRKNIRLLAPKAQFSISIWKVK